jgi:hypothetical protein
MNRFSDLLLNVSHSIYCAAFHVCCDCRLPNWLGKHFFDGNCLCACHDLITYRENRKFAVLLTARSWSLIWRSGVTPGFDPTAWSSLQARLDGVWFIKIDTFFDDTSLSLRWRTREWRWCLPIFHPKWHQRLLDRALWALVQWGSNRANPEISVTSEQYYADQSFYGGE